MLFRVRKEITWNGRVYDKGEIFEIEEGHPRIRAMLEQSHHLEYANCDAPDKPQGKPVGQTALEEVIAQVTNP